MVQLICPASWHHTNHDRGVMQLDQLLVLLHQDQAVLAL